MNAQEDSQCIHAIIDGRVQGVGFRYFVYTHARDLNLTGWVRNTYQGQVEVIAEGNRQDIDTLLEHLRKGPPSGYVLEVNYEYKPFSGSYSSFEVAASV